MRITPNGLSFAFDFHRVRRIVIGPVQRCSNFVTRRVYLIDAHGGEVDVTCFSDDGASDIPVRVEADEEAEEESEEPPEGWSEMTSFLRQIPNLMRPVKVAVAAGALLLSVTAAQAQVQNYTTTPQPGGGWWTTGPNGYSAMTTPFPGGGSTTQVDPGRPGLPPLWNPEPMQLIPSRPLPSPYGYR